MWKLISRFFSLSFFCRRSQLAKSKSNSVVSQTQQKAEEAKERLKRLNDLVAKEHRTSIDQTSSDEETEKVNYDDIHVKFDSDAMFDFLICR